MDGYEQPALPTYNNKGWLFNSIDYQIVTKSDGWNQDQTKRLTEFQEGKNKGMTYAALAVPYDNVTKYRNYVQDARAKGLKIWHRSHWNAWQGDNGVGDIATSTSLTRSGSVATCVTNTPHGLQTGDTVSINGVDQVDYRGEHIVTVVNSTTFTFPVSNSPTTPATGNIGWRYGRATYIRKTKQFIIDNSDLFQSGDIFGMCVEADQADSSNLTFKTPGTTTFNTAIYNQFQIDQVFYANEAFELAGITGVYTWGISHQLANVNLNGQTLSSGNTGNPAGLGTADILSKFDGIFCFDHYEDDAITDPATYAAAYSASLEAIHQAFPGCKLFIGEWGWRTILPASEAQQLAVYKAVVDVLLSKDYIIGVNFWNHLGQLQSSLWDDTSGTIVAGGRDATNEVSRAFNTLLSFLVPPPVVEPPPPPPPTENPIIVSTIAKYQILVRDKQGNLLGEINDWHNLSFSDRLNNFGTCQFEIPARSPDLINSVSLRRYEVLILRNNQVVWSGEQAQRSVKLEANSPQMVTITSYTFVEQLLHMVTPDYIRFEQVDQGLILKALVDYYQSLPNGNFGFTFAPITPTKPRDQEYSNYEILNAFVNMSNRINGIDFWIDENKVIHIVPLRGTDLSKQIILEYGTNFLNVAIDEDFSTPANEAIVLGAGFGAEQKKGGFLDVSASNIYGLRQRVVSEIDVSEIDTLNDKGEAFVSKYKTALRSIQGVQIPKTQPEFGSFQIGDTIGQKVKEGTYNIDSKFRVYGYEVKIGPGGEENVSYLTAQPEVLSA